MFPNPTSAETVRKPKSHERTWCIVQIPACCAIRALRRSMKNPPTALVGFAEHDTAPSRRLSMNDPPTALVGLGRIPTHQTSIIGSSPEFKIEPSIRGYHWPLISADCY